MYCVDYQYLRPKKAEALKKWYSEDFIRKESLDIWQGRNCTLLPIRACDSLLFGQGGVVDAQGEFVPLSGIPRRVEGKYHYENPTFIDQKVVYCGYMVNQWGHFLVEATARLWYYMENDATVDKYVFLLNENEQRKIKSNYKEFFVLLGIWEKLEFISKPTCYREVIVPEMSFCCRKYYSDKFLKIFEYVAENIQVDPTWESPSKIFYSRSKLAKSNGMEFGLEMLDDFFSRNGYTILYPERVPLSQMIHYIRNSDTVASLSGSLPHNMLFASQGQNLVIVERCILNNDFQMCINQMKELHATYIDANIGIYTVDMCGPFIMACNPILERYCADNQMKLPDTSFLTKKYLNSCFKKYMYAYQDMYRYQWYMDDWYADCADYLLEAYTEGASYFHDYLSGNLPFLPEHYFQFHYFKQFVKRVLYKLNLLHR